MRIFNELNGRNQGVYLVRKEMMELKNYTNDYINRTEHNLGAQGGLVMLNKMISYCNDLLDITTLGEIKERISNDIQKENGII